MMSVLERVGCSESTCNRLTALCTQVNYEKRWGGEGRVDCYNAETQNLVSETRRYIKGDLESFLYSLANIFSTDISGQVWGCGGQGLKEKQEKHQQWERKQAEKLQKVSCLVLGW